MPCDAETRGNLIQLYLKTLSFIRENQHNGYFAPKHKRMLDECFTLKENLESILEADNKGVN